MLFVIHSEREVKPGSCYLSFILEKLGQTTFLLFFIFLVFPFSKVEVRLFSFPITLNRGQFGYFFYPRSTSFKFMLRLAKEKNMELQILHNVPLKVCRLACCDFRKYIRITKWRSNCFSVRCIAIIFNPYQV